MTDPDSQLVSYTVKELLARLDIKVDTVIHELREKADKGDLRDLEHRVKTLETYANTSAGANRAWRWAAPLLLSGLSLAVAVLLRFN